MTKKMTLIAVMTLFSSPTLAGLAHAEDDLSEYEAMRRSSISLEEAIRAAQRETGGTAISAEFTDEDGTYVYEVELVTEDDMDREVYIDPASGSMIEMQDESGDDEGDD